MAGSMMESELPLATVKGRPQLLSVDDALEMTPSTLSSLVEQHMVPGTQKIFKRVGFDRTIIRHAEGMYYTDQSDRQILDFFGNFGASGLGHNHPRILAARQRFADQRRPEIALVFMSPYVAALSANLATLAPGDLDIVMLCQSGSEANEIALRAAEAAAGHRSHVAYASRSFHGKTRAALSVTDSEMFRLGVPMPPGRVKVPFGDPEALESAFRRDPLLGVLILEPIQGGAGIVLPPPGYLQEVRRLCDQYGIIWIADEVQCGFGRTGRFFAFEHADVVPDIVTMAKSLGGDKAAIGAVIARPDIISRQPNPKMAAFVFSPSTFSGMGESCVTAIEAINVLVEENLMANAVVQGDLLMASLNDLQKRHPESIAQVRGAGCMVGIEFADVLRATLGRVGNLGRALAPPLAGGVSVPIGALLFHDHASLVGFTEYDRNVLRIQPPLILDASHVQAFTKGLGEVLDRGPRKLIFDFVKATHGS